MTKWRRFEILLNHQFNDGRNVPEEWLVEALDELVGHFSAASFETRAIQGKWRHAGMLYRDDLSKVIVDVPDTMKNRAWMKKYKERWRVRLEQIELWMINYRIEVG